MGEAARIQRVLQRSLGYLFSFPGMISGALLSLLFSTGFVLAGPLVLRLAMDEGVSKKDFNRLSIFAAAFLLLEVSRIGSEAVQGLLLKTLAHHVAGKMRSDLFRHIQRLPLSWFGKTPPTDVASRVNGDVTTWAESFSRGVLGLARDLAILVGTSVIILFLQVRFGVVTLGLALLAALPAILIRKSAERQSVFALEAISKTEAVLEENIAGHIVIQLHGIASLRAERFSQENEKWIKSQKKALALRSLFEGGASVMAALGLTLIIGIGGGEMAAGRLSLGLFFAFIQYGSSILGSVRGISERGVALMAGAAAGRRIFETLDLPEALAARVKPETPATVGGDLSLKDLRFGYQDGVDVLRGVSAEANPLERLALVGRTGAGKTTLARLITRLYDPREGRVAWGGRDLREIPVSHLRRETCFSPQEVSILSTSILENIRMDGDRISRTEVIDACREAGAHEFIENFPKGYDTLLTTNGQGLSVGERQLLSIARVVVRQPKILVLDEPTSHLDPKTEGKILSALERVLRGRLSILIAHRYSTLAQCDRVWVLDSGRLVEDGPPGELLSRPGLLATRGGVNAPKGARAIEG